jgi:pyruvate/2-oxoglutarate dehydrogenase complex dihydrolipoamide dehydrogenase (E3) component
VSHPAPELLPRDAHNAALLAHVHPRDWKNPEPAARYNLVVIGAGTAGLITASVAAGIGARVALVERHLMGGDCLNVGCVPSKALIRASRAAAEARRAARFGVTLAAELRVDFAAVMERLRRVRAQIAADDGAPRYRDELGVDVFLGQGKFIAPDRAQVDGAELRFARAVIATGARATAPPIPGLAEAGYLTNETLFERTELPARLAVIGAGPIGCEMAQAFRRLGSAVTLFEVMPQILGREDPDAVAIVGAALERDGVKIELSAKLLRVERTPAGKRIHYQAGGAFERSAEFDEILVGAGRAPNVQGLGLEAAGVEFDAKQGVRVDERLRTTNRRIYAAGDVCMAHKFTHAADAAAKIVVRNALFPFGRQKHADLVMPWCTYTDPEIAHVGLYESDAAARGIAIDTFKVPLERVNRAALDDETEGFVKVHVRRGSDRVVGATIVASHAGEMISELTLAIGAGLGLAKLASAIHPYPTQAEGIKAAANAYLRTRLTPFAKRAFGWYFRRARGGA